LNTGEIFLGGKNKIGFSKHGKYHKHETGKPEVCIEKSNNFINLYIKFMKENIGGCVLGYLKFQYFKFKFKMLL
jgi:hypothetical protein